MGRTQTSATILHSIFREKTIGISEDREIDWGKKILQKRYLALVFGVPKQSKGLISVPLAKILGHQDEVWYLQFSHNGKYLASADQLLYGRYTHSLSSFFSFSYVPSKGSDSHNIN